MRKAMYYTATALGLGMTAMVLVFAVGEGMPNPFTQPPAVRMEFAAMGLMMLGSLLSLKWGRAGGVVTLAGFGLFQGVEWAENHRFFPFLLIYAASGLLHVLCPPRRTAQTA